MLASLRVRLLVAFLAPTLLLLALAGAAGYALTRRILEDELGRGLSRIAAGTAAQMNAERLMTLQAQDDVDGSRTWRNFARDLEAIRLATGARRIFAVDLDGRVRVDAGGALPVGAQMPELARDRLELASVRAGQRAWSQVLFEGADGLLYKTGYAPVRNGEGVVAVVGVEGTSSFFGPLRRLFRGYAAMVAAAALLLAAIALLTARGVSRPLERLMGAALRIRGGDLQTPVPAEATLEIGVLAKELESMRQALEGRDRQLKMMLAGVAHEVRNPIGGIALFAGLLAEELADGPGESRSHVEKIRKEIHYLQRIVEDFLAFARERRLSLAPLEGESWVRAAAELMATDAAGRAVTLELLVEPGKVEADESLLVSALTNLIKNAIQAAPGASTVRILARPEGAHYKVTVSDAGSGIPTELRERIFEPFFTTREQGTGLGLPLARKIAQAHGGELSVRSHPGETVFSLQLPLA